MGLVKFGGGVIQISGSIAGNVHARNRFGNYIRPRTKPVNPHSDRQEAIRAILSHLAEHWHTEMNDTERNLWNVYAAAVAMKNRIGETIHLTGFNHFLRTNCPQRMLTEDIKEAAPGTLSLREKDETTVCGEENIAGQTFTFTFDSTGWGVNPDDKYWLCFYQGQPQLVSRHFFAGPWRFMSAAGTVAGNLGTQQLPAEFAFALGQKVWFQARMLSFSGRTSQVWTLPPRTIEADPP